MPSIDNSIVIVSGCPGTGKTTLSRALARAIQQGVHIVSDQFFGFIAEPIVPSLPEAHTQNATVTQAVARAAAAYVRGGYRVVLDGVIGPWFLGAYRREFGSAVVSIHYVVLRADLAETIRRGTTRSDPTTETMIRAMYPKFLDLGPFERHCVQTSMATTDAVLSEVLQGLQADRFLLA